MLTRLRARLSRISFLLARRRFDADTRLEIDTHLDLLTERYQRQGLSRDAAYVAARRQFGNTTLMRQQIHEMNSMRWLEQSVQDAGYAFRQLRGNAGYTAVVVATLGLGLGGAIAVYSVVRAVLLAPLPYQEPGQLVRFYQQDPSRPEFRGVVAGTHFSFVREHAASFADVAALAHYSETGLDLAVGGRVQRLRVLRVSAGYFETLRAQPVIGRGFERDDETGTRRVVLGDSVWRTYFGGDRSIVGQTVRLSAQSYEVAGVAPPGFQDPFAPDVAAWIPYDLAGDVFDQNYALTPVGRLRDGVTLAQAQAELATLEPRMRERWPNARQSEIIAVPLHEELVARARGPLQLVFASVALVLLVVSVNVANLALVRATGRVQEFAVRAALGSSRSRLARQLLIESLLLATLGGVAGVLLAAYGMRVLKHLGRDALPRLDEVALNPAVMVFALGVTAVTGIAFGLAPVFRLARTAPVDALRQQSRSTTGTRAVARLRNSLAAAQIALAVTLVAGAGILLASFHRLQRVDLGFRTDRVLTFEIHLPAGRYEATERAMFQEELARRLELLPGVTAAGGVSRLPATGNYHPWNTRILTGPSANSTVSRRRFVLQQRVVSGHLFAALGLPLLAGRTFDDRDDAEAPGRAVVSANFARAAFPGLPFDAIPGQRISIPVGDRQLEIIGVVGDVALNVYGTETMIVYHAHRQFAANRNWALTQVVAGQGAPEQLLSAIRAEVARVDPELVVYRPTPMTEIVNRGTRRERFVLVLMGTFAATALGLAALGLYGVLAYAVRQRSPEIGIRIALGASAYHVRALVFRQASALVGGGVTVGLGGAVVLGRSLDALAFGVAPADPWILFASAGTLVVVAFAAAWLPARRAAGLEPRAAMHEG